MDKIFRRDCGDSYAQVPQNIGEQPKQRSLAPNDIEWGIVFPIFLTMSGSLTLRHGALQT
jgi:hypothetical protein